MTYREAIRKALCKATGQAESDVEGVIEPLVCLTPDFRSVDLDAAAPSETVSDLLDNPKEVQSWIMAGVVAAVTGDSNGTIEGYCCPITGHITLL